MPVTCAAWLFSSSVAYSVPGSSKCAVTEKLSKSGGGVSTIVRIGGARSWVRTNAIHASWLLRHNRKANSAGLEPVELYGQAGLTYSE